jgi:hypothetical protein
MLENMKRVHKDDTLNQREATIFFRLLLVLPSHDCVFAVWKFRGAKRTPKSAQLRFERTPHPNNLDEDEILGEAEDKSKRQKNGSFSLIERVILSAGAMLIFSVSFQIDQMPEGEVIVNGG